MKNFVKWRVLVITCVVCLLPVLLGLVLWNKLPENIAIHFDMNGNPDNYAPKSIAVFGLPCMMAIIQIVCCVSSDINEKKFGEKKKISMVMKGIIPVMSVLVQGITLAHALEISVDIRKCVMTIVGGVLIVVGNYLPKLDRVNTFKGMMADKEKARRFNRLMGYTMVILGIFAIITAFLPPIASVIWLFLTILHSVVTLVYTIKVSVK